MAKKTNFKVNGHEYFKVTRTIGHKSDGTPIKKPFYGSCKSEAEEKANAYMQNLKLGLQTNSGSITISNLFPNWLFKNKKNELKPSTFESYEGLYRNYIETDIISNRPINEIKSINVQQYYDRLSKRKAVHSNKNVSSKRIKSIHKLLHLFFVYAEKEGYTLRNPCNTVTLPKDNLTPEEILDESMQFDFFTEEEIPVLLSAFNGSSYQDIIAFAIATGMRQGEILGLQWSDVDFENNVIHILHNLSNSADFDENRKKKYTLKIVTPKSKNSIRTIPMNNTVLEILKNKEHICDTVFCNKRGHFINSKNLGRRWTEVLKASSLRYRTFHDLRHTFGTIMLSKGCDLITLKELMGHSSIKITEIYLEAIPKIKHEIVKNMDFISY